MIRCRLFPASVQVIFHLQTRRRPVLPPLRDLLEGGALRLSWLQGSAVRLLLGRNRETLAELFASFFATWRPLLAAWINSREAYSVRASTWSGWYREDAQWEGLNRRHFFAIEGEPAKGGCAELRVLLRAAPPPACQHPPSPRKLQSRVIGETTWRGRSSRRPARSACWARFRQPSS